MVLGPGLVYDILGSVRYHSVMKRRHQIATLVVLVAVASVTGRSSSRTEMRKSPRVFVNTSIPFSVAPQPVKDTHEVAQAKQHFMKTFRRIQDAVIAADTEHLNYTLLDDDLTNNIDDPIPEHTTSTTTRPTTTRPTTTRPTTTRPTTTRPTTTTTTPEPVQATNSSVNRGPALAIGAAPGVAFSIFPDPVLEPEYFLSSVHVDPFLMSQFDPPLPPNPFIQQIRPISDPGLVGTCYEIILLEPEELLFHLPRGSPIIPIGTPALPGASSSKPVAHFKAPQLSFLSLLQGDAQIPTGR